MKYKILKEFKGSQDGTTSELFEAGTTRELSDWLVASVDPSCIELAPDDEAAAAEAAAVDNKAITTDGSKPAGKKR